MNNRFTGLFAFLLIILMVWINFKFEQPVHQKNEELSAQEFSTNKAFEHVKAISEKPHYLGSAAHSHVRNYIVDQLQQMGLEVQTQEAYSLNDHGTLAKPQNILARIKGTGNGNALVLMSHYDSATHSSFGASDAASGVATVLEGIRAFLEKTDVPENDIIILFTDGEELGLNGALLFVNDHPWVQDAKLALNFEARGSGGSPYMLLETNGKNAKLIEAFKEADPKFPVTTSLAYSIYKMLPNDTDLTVLRENADINGYNFAFIDDHFDYHTANDITKNLNPETLKHQGTYLMPLLEYFSEKDLTDLSSDRDLIYFNLPFGELITYPFDWILPMLALAIILLLLLLIYGIRRERIDFGKLLLGFVPLLMSILGSGLLMWGLWQLLLVINPSYSEMEHGFTYNGYWYIPIAVFLSLTLCFFIYNAFRKQVRGASAFIAPLILWLVICTLIASYLKGASYFIIPVFFGLIQLFVMIRQKHPNRLLMALLSGPAIFILLPFIYSLPVALGLKMLYVTSILIVLLFSLFIPVFIYFRKLRIFGILSMICVLVLMIIAQCYSGFDDKRPKPNSLVYLKDLDENSATWNTYDGILDEWNESYFKTRSGNSFSGSAFSSKYGTGFKNSAEAPVIDIPEPSVILEKTPGDSVLYNSYILKIAPNRPINRMELFELKDVNFEQFKVNDLKAPDTYMGEEKYHIFKRRWKERLLTYFASNLDTLRIEFSVKKGQQPEFVLYESSYDLINHKDLKVKERPDGMIPRPFVLNDVTILKKTIRINE